MAQSVRVNISGMHCASCASVIERTLKKTGGVEDCEVNFGTEKAKISFDPNKTDVARLSKAVEPLGYKLREPEKPKDRGGRGGYQSDASAARGMSENEPIGHLGLSQSKQEKLVEIAVLKKKIQTVIPLALIATLIMGWEIFARFGIFPEVSETWMGFFHHLLPIMATYTLFIVGQPYLSGLYLFLRYGRANMDTLIGLGTLVAFIYSFALGAFEELLRPFLNVNATYYDVTIVVIAFISLGKYLEMRSKLKTGDAIEKLLNMQAKTALVIRNGREIEVPVDDVKAGELIIIKPAGKIPVDGVITEGASYIDEALVTGESLPVEKTTGDIVIAGTTNTNGAFTFRATKVGSETMLSHIIQLVEDAQGSKAPIQALADKISAVFVPIVLVLAFITLGIWLLVGTPIFGFSQAISFGLVSFVGILVIACPCALGLATPTAIIVGVGKGAKEGILIKDAASLEKLPKVKVLVADKTGTITKGQPELVSLKNLSDKSDDELLAILAALENKSEHPIASAIVKAAKKKGLALAPVEGFQALKGQGLSGRIGGTEYFAGNLKLAEALKLSFDRETLEEETKKGRTPVLITIKDKAIGLALVADPVKPEAAEAVKQLHKLGIKVVMLTGDHKNTAQYIASQVGIDEIVAEVMPSDKLQKIKEFQAQGLVVAMAGDGVNDAPALAQADIGIAMATGTDVAIESADITLLHGDISKIVKAIHLSKITMRGIRQNLFWAFIYNIIGIPLAGGAFFPLFGWLLSPVFAGFAMAASSVSVVANSLRLKTKRL